MELRHLRYFVTIAETGSFSAAAEKLFISQPPLSSQIKQLEEEIGVPLFTRLPRGVQLTQAGIRFLTESKAILAHVERAKAVARHANNENGGHLSIGFVPSASHTILPRFIAQLRLIRPDIEISVKELVTAEQIEAIEKRIIDVGISRPSNLTRHNTTVAAEISDPFCIAMPLEHPLAKLKTIDLRQIATENFVFFTRFKTHAYFDQIIGLCTDAGFSPIINCEASTIYGVLDLVQSSLGISIVPASTVLLKVANVAIIPLETPSRDSSIALLHAHEVGDSIIKVAGECMNEVFSALSRDINTLRTLK